MSERIRSTADYLRLLLNTNNEQSRILLNSATSKQTEALCEIAFNLLTLPLPPKIRRFLNRNKKLLQRLSKKKTSFKQRSKILRKYFRQILKILLKVKQFLLKIL